jgi:hypothetical protein
MELALGSVRLRADPVLVRHWGLILLGLAFFLAALLQYESWGSREIFERWSRGYVAFVLVCAVGLLGASFAAVRRSMSHDAVSASARCPRMR